MIVEDESSAFDPFFVNGRNQESDFPRKRSTLRIGLPAGVPGASVKPDDHSEVVPLLPIPNRTVKRLSADDIAGSRVKVGHRQAINTLKASVVDGGLFYCAPE